MRRRALLVAGSAWLASVAARSLAQAPTPRRIAFVHPGLQQTYGFTFDAFRESLKALGYVDGRDVAFEVRWAEGRHERLEALAAELVALKPALILTGSSAGVAACMKATTSIPIVFATAGDPVGQGFVASLRRPGGNVTGVAVHSELHEKIVEIAAQALPAVRRLAILVHDADRAHRSALTGFNAGVRRFKLEPVIVRIARADEMDRAFHELGERKVDAVVVPNLVLLTSLRHELADRARRARLPLVGINLPLAEAGALLSYGIRAEENWRRAAVLVDKILRGARPADLPVERPERLELIVNLKTAKAIGITLSPTTMLRATKVIE